MASPHAAAVRRQARRPGAGRRAVARRRPQSGRRRTRHRQRTRRASRSGSRGPLVLIVGMLANKDSAGFLKELHRPGAPASCRRCRSRSRKAACRAAALAEAARAIGLPAQESADLETALAALGRLDSRAAAMQAFSSTGSLLPGRRRARPQRHAAGLIRACCFAMAPAAEPCIFKQ